MNRKLVLLVVLFIVFSQIIFSQTVSEENAEDNSARLKEQTAEMLRETSQMISSLSSSENRIGSTIKAADVIWDLDEQQARTMFEFAMGDLRRSISEVNGEFSRIQNAVQGDWANSGSIREVRTKAGKIISSRSSLINTLSNHDPQWALLFLQETNQMATSEELGRRFTQSSKSLETAVARKIAGNDVTKALELGREKLSKGVTNDVVGLLQQIYAKDPEKGADFGGEILKKIKSVELKSVSSWTLTNLLQRGATSYESLSKSNSTKRPLFGEADLRTLADLLGESILNSSSRTRYLSSSAIRYLEKYAPQRAVEVKRLQEQRNTAGNSNRNRNSNAGRASSNTNSGIQRMNESRAKSQQEISRSMQGLQAENLNAEDKKRIIEETRSKILMVNNDSFRFSNLVSLATQAVRIGEKELAGMLLNEAEGFINRQPKERRDFTDNRNLANAYIEINPDKSFAILEDMVFRLNDAVDGYVKFNEFTGNSRAVESGELLINNYSRQFTGYLTVSGTTLMKLAETDFNRVKGLADKFARPELRVETRLMLAKSLLSVGQQSSNVRVFEVNTRFSRNGFQ